VGNADNKPMGGTSSLVAAPIWREFMTAALKDKPVVQFPVPSGVEFAKVCATTGAAPTNSCGKVVTEPFLAGRLPQGVKAEKQDTQPAVSQPKTNPTPVPQQAQQPPPQQTPFGAGLASTPVPQTPVQQTPRPGQQTPVGVTPVAPPGTPRPTVIVTTPVVAPNGPRIPGEPPPGTTPNPTGNRSGF
jgi:penicillin-binding protein 1A